jgi:GNAT superfamily N-acetyltransferase
MIMSNKGILFLFLTLSVMNVELQCLPLELVINELGMGIKSYSLRATDNSCVCSLTATEGKNLALFDSSIFSTIDVSEMPPEIPHLIAAVKAIKIHNDLNSVVMIGDLYTPLAHRGKGYATYLLKEACLKIFNDGINVVVLIPDPFEHEDGKQKLLIDEIKKQKLVRLYQSCGFKKDNENIFTFMYRTSEQH